MNSFEDHPQKIMLKKNHDNDTEYAYSKIFFICIITFFKIRKEKKRMYIDRSGAKTCVRRNSSSFIVPSTSISHIQFFLFCMLLLCYLWVLRLSVSHAESRFKMNVKVHSHQSYLLLLIFYSFPFLRHWKISIKKTKMNAFCWHFN